MQAAEFDRLVAAACERIPARFRKRLKNVAMMVEAEPMPAQLARGRVPHGGTLLGLYEGRPLTVRSVFEPFAMPDRITIFQGPHERMARAEHLAKLVEDTVWHEVAHYFGLNEREVRAAERGGGESGSNPRSCSFAGSYIFGVNPTNPSLKSESTYSDDTTAPSAGFSKSFSLSGEMGEIGCDWGLGRDTIPPAG